MPSKSVLRMVLLVIASRQARLLRWLTAMPKASREPESAVPLPIWFAGEVPSICPIAEDVHGVARSAQQRIVADDERLRARAQAVQVDMDVIVLERRSC